MVTSLFLYKEMKWLLTELAPGLDLHKDILDQMAFTPLIADDLKGMESHLFEETWSLKNGQTK